MSLHLDDDDYESAQLSQSWWIGLPLSKHVVTDAEQEDAFFSKLGGVPSLLRSIERDAQCPVMKCTLCGKCNASRLLCQFYAPLERQGLERVLYIVQCDRCSTKDSSHLFMYRSTAFNWDLMPESSIPSTSNQQQPAAATPAAANDKEQLFEETDDWGDEDAEAEASSSAPSPAPVPLELETKAVEVHAVSAPPTVVKSRPVVTLAAPGTVVPNISKKIALPPLALDVFEEPQETSRTRPRGVRGGASTAEDQLMDAERDCGEGVVDRDSMEADDESVEERCTRRYMEKIRRYPSQCIRWSHSGTPLFCRADDLPPQPIPPCDGCGAARVFECELVSPAIFFLTKGLPEDQHTLHFGTVLCYTCSADCDDHPYVKEYCFTQREI
ncbi:programmed cell death protein 2, putative [Bodo saltans]|uniref:Programmed cell death protein 2, putative n=1 Tax=Bodo saltans TaxID=75058 RepID=A0A0S4JQH8_BODSA|nr:programmed cell death protein 2, putative [Bodo saltans]|eukprot:CUG91302.1 programmed cell death protein 2, putative [Bodo saltans]